MSLPKKMRLRLEREMYREVARENEREGNGTATRERVVTAMAYIMKPGQTYNNEIFVVLSQMLGNEKPYKSKYEIKAEAMRRLYAEEPESESDSTSETIIVDLDELDWVAWVQCIWNEHSVAWVYSLWDPTL